MFLRAQAWNWAWATFLGDILICTEEVAAWEVWKHCLGGTTFTRRAKTGFTGLVRSGPFTATRFHPAEKPLEIIRKMLEEATRPGDPILDPSVGSGTTAVACKQLRRKYIGFEINPEYVAVAEARLKESCARGTLQDLAA